MLWLTACGTESNAPDQTALLATTQTIAQDFVRSGDQVIARAALDALPVANANQWLIYATEQAIGDATLSPEMVAAMIRLSSALGLRSNTISQYALANNLALDTATNPEPVAAVQPTATATLTPPIEAAAIENGTIITSSAPSVSTAISDSAPVAQTVSETVAISVSTSVSDTAALDTTDPISEDGSTAPTAAVTSTLLLSDTPTAPVALAPANPSAQTTGPVNLRSGPGTNYGLVAGLQPGESLQIAGKSPAGDWWQVTTVAGISGWVFGQLVSTSGDVSQVAIALDIPPAPTLAPATPVPPTAQPVAQVPATQPPAAPATVAPAAPPTAPPAPPAAAGPAFTVLERRLWNVEENGGFLDGNSVHCGEKRELWVKVVDANGVLVNGVAVQEIFGAQDIYVTGAQGKGDGAIEIILGEGQDVKVVKDADGRAAQSDIAAGLTTRPSNIPYDVLRGGRYCTDDESCRKFVESFGCFGHYSWSVTFKRNY